MKYWEIVADKLSASGWSWGYCSAVTPHGWRWIVNAHKGDGKRYIVQSDELLSAFLEMEAMRCDPARLPVGHLYIQNTPQFGSTNDCGFVISQGCQKEP